MKHAFVSLKRTKNSFRKLALKTVEACLLVLIFFSLLPTQAEAVINQKINYQGKLTDSSGVAVTDGSYNIVFNLYTQASGGSSIWTETLSGANAVTVTDGLFSVLLGNVSSLANVNFSQTLYLGVNVGGDGEMTPRKEIGSVPSAFVAYALDAVNATSTNATTTNLAITGLATPAGTFLAVNQNGQVIATTTPSTSNWADQGSYLTPLTTTDGILLTGSSTINNLTMLNSTTTNATTTNLYVSGTATSTFGGGILVNSAGIRIANLNCSGVSGLLQTDASGHLICGTDDSGAGGGIVVIQENDSDVTTSATAIDFLGADFDVTGATGEGDISIDYTNSGITRKGQNETVTGAWTFNNLLSLGQASSTRQSIVDRLYIGGTATTTITGDSATSTFSGGITLTTGNLNLPTNGVFLINNANILSATALGSTVTASSLTSVGALSSGSLAAGFGSIMINNSTSTITNLTMVNSTSTNATTTRLAITSLGTAAGTFLAVDATGRVIATSTPSSSNWTDAGLYLTPLTSTDGIILSGSSTIANLSTSNSTTTNATTTNQYVSGNLNLASGLALNINGVNTLSATALGSAVVSSSLTSVGILNGGSITNGFGSIDIGADALTAGAASFTTIAGSGLATITGGILVNNSTSTITNLTMVNSTSTNATTTRFAITGLATPAGTILAVNSLGQVIATTTPSSSNWTDQGAYLTPLTSTDGILINSASSTITNLVTLRSTSTNATTTYLAVTGSATSTFGGSIDLVQGCFSVAGGCIGGISTTRFDPAVTQRSRSTSYTLTASFADVTLDTTDVQNDANTVAFDAVNTERIYVYQTGLYELHYHADVAQGTSVNDSAFQIVLNAATVVPGSTLTAKNSSTDKGISSAIVYASLTAGDYVRVQARYPASSGGSLANFTFSVKRVVAGSGIGGTEGTANTLAYYSTATTLGSASMASINTGMGTFGIGTSTPRWTLQLASSTAPQLTLTAGATDNHWSFRNMAGTFVLGTSSPTTFSTSTTPQIQIAGTGFGTTTLSGLNIAGSATSTSNVGFNLTAGCFAIGGTCIGSGGSSNWTDAGLYLTPLTSTDGIILSGSSTIANLSTSNSTTTNATTTNQYVSGNLNLASGLALNINGVNTLSATALGSAVVSSSLTSVGILNGGSITNGFGSIDIGADALTAGAASFTTIAGSGLATITGGILVNNATSTITNLTMVNSTSTNATTTRLAITSLGTAAGTFLAVDPTGRVIATSTPSSSNWTDAGLYLTPLTSTDGIILSGSSTIANLSTSNSTTTNATTTNQYVSGNLNLASGLALNINGVNTLSATALGSAVVSSSLTSVGILNGGSITNGFGSIDIGADALTAGAASFTTIAGSGLATITGGILVNNSTSTITNLTMVNSTSTSATTTNLAIANLATPAGTFLAVNPNGQVIATTTPAAAAGTLTGSTLAAGVTASSLTSVGTLTSLAVSGLSTLSGGILANSSTSTITNLTMVNSTTTNATTTNLHVSNNLAVELSTTNPGFVVSNTGSSTPAFYIGGVNQNGYIGIGTSTPTEALSLYAGNFLQSPGNPVLVGNATLSTGSFTKTTIVAGRYAYVADEDGSAFKIFSLATSSPAQVGTYSFVGIRGVAVSGRYAYVMSSSALRVIDISNPTSPTLVGSVSLGGAAVDVVVAGRHAYVIDSTADDLKVVDISNPTLPVVAGSVSLGGGGTPVPADLVVSGRYAYVIDSGANDLKTIDITNPTAPTIEDSLTIGGTPADIAISGSYVYVTDVSSTDLKVIDVSNPTAAVTAGSVSIGSVLISAVAVSGRYVYVGADSAGLKVYDVSNPAAPYLTGTLALGATPRSLAVSGRYAYVAGSGSLYTVDLSGIEVTSGIVHSLEAGNIHVRESAFIQNNLSVGSSLNVGTGGIFSSGPLSVSVASSTATNPISAYFQGAIGVASTSPWGQLSIEISTSSPSFVVANTGSTTPAFYIGGTNQNGHIGIGTSAPTEALHVASGSLLHTPGTLKQVGSSSLGGGTPTPTSIAAAGRFVYVMDNGNTTLKIFDTSTSSPSLIGSLSSFGANDKFIAVSGQYVYVGSSGASFQGDTFKIVDVSNPTSPVLVSTLSGLTAVNAIYISGKYAYISQESSLLSVIDISIPTSPILVGTLAMDSEGFIRFFANLVVPKAHAIAYYQGSIYVAGHYAYFTNVSADELEIVDISNPTLPVTVGTVDLGDTDLSITTRIKVAVSGRYAYVMNVGNDDCVSTDSGASFCVVDVSNPASPNDIGYESTGTLGETLTDMVIAGRYAYVVNDSDNELQVIDLIDPTTPTMVAGIAVGSSPVGVAVAGRYAYVVDSTTDDIKKIDISGVEATSGFFHSLQAGDFRVSESADIAQNLRVGNGINIGQGGLFSSGPIAISFNPNNATTSALTVDGNYLFTATTSYRSISIATSTTAEQIGGELRISAGDGSPSECCGGGGDVVINGGFRGNGGLNADGDVILANLWGKVGIGDSSPASLFTVGAGDLFQIGTTGVVLNAVGSVSLPSVSFKSDANTGMWSPAADMVAFSTGGTERWRISNVGATTTVPNAFNAWSIASSTPGNGINSIISVSQSSTGATSTVGFFVATTTGLSTGSGLGLPSALKNYVIVGSGKVQAGIGIVNGGLCVDDDGWCTASTTGRISSVTSTTGGTDVAELYFSDDSLEPGDLVMADTPLYHVARATNASSTPLLGIVATEPGVILGLPPDAAESPNQFPISLSGRVPTKVNDEGGAIQIGDQITISSVPGVGRKAAYNEPSVGVALESYTGSGEGSINVFVNLEYKPEPPVQAQTLLGIESINSILQGNSIANLTVDKLIVTGDAEFKGTVTVKDLVAEKICLGATCIDEDMLKVILEEVNLGQVLPPPPTTTTTPNIIPNPDPNATTTPPVATTTPPIDDIEDDISVDPNATSTDPNPTPTTDPEPLPPEDPTPVPVDPIIVTEPEVIPEVTEEDLSTEVTEPAPEEVPTP